MLNNIISNVIKFIECGVVIVKVCIDVFDFIGMFIIIISDIGIGIVKEKILKLFNVF